MKRLLLMTLLFGCSASPTAPIDMRFGSELLPAAPGSLADYAVLPWDRGPMDELEDRPCVFHSNPVCVEYRELPPERSSEPGELVWRAGGCELRVAEATGGESLIDLARYGMPSGGAASTLLSDAEAELIAGAYVARALPVLAAAEHAPPRIRELAIASAEADGDGLPVGEPLTEIAGYTVSYQRLLDGIAVDGPGGWARVYLDAGGSPIGHAHVWRDLERLQPEPIISPDELRLRFLAQHAGDGAARLAVEEVRLVYLAEGRWRAQQLLSPVYLVIYRHAAWSRRVLEVWDARRGVQRD